MLKNANLGFKEKSDLLSWFVDSMRVMVLNTLEEKEVLQAMDENQKNDLIEELNELHKKCAD
jgi:Mg/Co/Ni transporter MgtE